METTITPMLSVEDAGAAIAFYAHAFDATVIERSEFGPNTVAELAIGGARFYVVTQDPDRGNVSPRTNDGRTSVRIDLIVDDPDAVARQAIEAGARELFPVADQPYGFRQGRVVDPEGHHWLVGKPLGA
jgi:PhnB protein